MGSILDMNRCQKNNDKIVQKVFEKVFVKIGGSYDWSEMISMNAR